MWLTAIMMGAMGTANVINGYQTRKKQREQLREQRDLQLKEMDLTYKQKEEEANKNADSADRKSTFNEGFIAENANSQFEMLAANQEQEGLSFNMEAMQSGAQKGSGLAQLAASGTRNSSVATAIDLESAVNAAQLQAKENYSKASADYNINNILRSYNNDVFTLQENRTGAMDLRNSYKEGGYNNQIYKTQRELLENNYNNKIDDLEDSFWTSFSEFMGGAQQGYSLASGIENFGNDLNTKFSKTDGTFSFNNLSSTSANKINTNLIKLNSNDWYSGLYK